MKCSNGLGLSKPPSSVSTFCWTNPLILSLSSLNCVPILAMWPRPIQIVASKLHSCLLTSMSNLLVVLPYA